MSDTNYNGVLLEGINGKFDYLVDAMKGMREEMKDFAKQSDLEEVKQDVKTIKAVVTQTNKDLHSLDRRVTTLEKIIT